MNITTTPVGFDSGALSLCIEIFTSVAHRRGVVCYNIPRGFLSVFKGQHIITIFHAFNLLKYFAWNIFVYAKIRVNFERL